MAEGDARKGYVLVVEDDQDLRGLHTEVLDDEGYVVRDAADGLAALEIIERHGPPVVVVLDLRMPRMDGWDLAARLRARPDWPPISIVVVAAHYRIAEEAARLNVQAWLHKPFGVEELTAVVARAYRESVGPGAGAAG